MEEDCTHNPEKSEFGFTYCLPGCNFIILHPILIRFAADCTYFSDYGKCSKISNTLKLRTPKIITENNF